MPKRLYCSSPNKEFTISELRCIPHARSSSYVKRVRKRSKNERFDRLRFEVGAGTQRPRIQHRRNEAVFGAFKLEDDLCSCCSGNIISQASLSRPRPVVDQYFEKDWPKRDRHHLQQLEFEEQDYVRDPQGDQYIDPDSSIQMPFSNNPHDSPIQARHITSDLDERADALHAGYTFIHQVGEKAQAFTDDIPPSAPARALSSPRKSPSSHGRASSPAIVEMTSDFRYMKTPAKACFENFASGKRALHNVADLRQLSNQFGSVSSTTTEDKIRFSFDDTSGVCRMSDASRLQPILDPPTVMLTSDDELSFTDERTRFQEQPYGMSNATHGGGTTFDSVDLARSIHSTSKDIKCVRAGQSSPIPEAEYFTLLSDQLQTRYNEAER